MKKVYLDAGHGGNDSGAVGVDGVLEKDIVLHVVKEISNILMGRGVDVRLSRADDTFKSLSSRSDDANKWGADAFVSIHCNSAGKSAKGLETFCYKFKYRELADCVQNKMISDKLYTSNRGVKEGNLHVVRETNMPACLVELGFISNEEDKAFIEANKGRMAISIADGICDFLGINYDSNSLFDSFSNGSYSGRKAKVVNVATYDVLNVRYDRDYKSNKVGELKLGDIVNCEYCLNGWMSIQRFKGNKGLGYVNSSYLQLI